VRASYFTQPAATPVASVSVTEASVPSATAAAEATSAEPTGIASPALPVEAAPAAPMPYKVDASVPASPATAATVAAMPLVSDYALPVESLQAVAQTSGLQWVNSDPARIAAVQAAIAAEVPAAHTPRERPAPITVDAGPLVLVETKRDLRSLDLPSIQ